MPGTKYITKPRTVEAVQFTMDTVKESIEFLKDWLNLPDFDDIKYKMEKGVYRDKQIVLVQGDSVITIDPTDFIVSENGFYFTMTERAFLETYELIN